MTDHIELSEQPNPSPRERLRGVLGVIGKRLTDLGVDAATEALSINEQGDERLLTELERLAERLSMVAEAATNDTAEVPTGPQERLGIEVMNMLNSLYGPQEIQAIGQMSDKQRTVLTEGFRALWYKYAEGRGKVSAMQVDRFDQMFRYGLSAKELATREEVTRPAVLQGQKHLQEVLKQASREELDAVLTEAQALEAEEARAPETITKKERTPLPLSAKEWLERTSSEIVAELQERYGGGSMDKYNAAATMLVPIRTTFTPLQKAIIRDMLRDLGVDVRGSSAELTRAMLDLPAKFSQLQFKAEHIKYFGMFVGLRTSVQNEAVSVHGLTEAMPIERIMQLARKNGANPPLISVQIVINQALKRYLKGTEHS